MRAVKSVLVVAGKLKRAEPGLPEDSLLMRALRDFNTPKIVHSDKVRAYAAFSFLRLQIFSGTSVRPLRILLGPLRIVSAVMTHSKYRRQAQCWSAQR